MTFADDLKTYKDFSSPTEDVDALLNNLAKEDNVPNDIFDNLKLRSVTHYYVPLCVFAGEMTVQFSCERTQGDQVQKIKDTMVQGVFLKIPCHKSGVYPAVIEQCDEVFEEISLGTADKKELVNSAKGWKVEFPEGVDAQAVVDQYQSQMLGMLREYAKDVLKEELGNVSKLKIEDLSFNAGGIDEHITGANLCRQPFSVMEYEYKGETFTAVYEKGKFIADKFPEDAGSKEVEGTYHKRMGICAVGIVLMLILQFALIHSWPVTFIVLVVLVGVLIKFRRDLSKIQEASSDARSSERAKLSAESFLAPLR